MEELAERILSIARDTLLVSLRFLDASLSALEFKSRGASKSSRTPGGGIPGGGTTGGGIPGTDGEVLYYDPAYILRLYKTDKNLPARAVLHSVLHCVFAHPFPRENPGAPAGVSSEKNSIFPDSDRKMRIRNLSCDIAVEYAIAGLPLPAVSGNRARRREKVFLELSEKGLVLTAENIFKYYLASPPDEETLFRLCELFAADDHGLWGEAGDKVRAVWKNISLRMQVDMETFSRAQAPDASALILNLKEACREVSDYAAFLHKFVTKAAGLRLDPEEFDYALYSLGMRMSGNTVPLIEQIEYKPSERVRDVVLSIYSTGLLSADKVKLFLLHTRKMLSLEENAFTAVRLHILCARREIASLPEGGETEDFIRSLKSDDLAGFFCDAASSAPDFRPAFNEVTRLSNINRFRNLKGLIVLTDAEGTFPSRMPPFPAAFIFVNNDYSSPPVPPWAIRLVLREDEL